MKAEAEAKRRAAEAAEAERIRLQKEKEGTDNRWSFLILADLVFGLGIEWLLLYCFVTIRAQQVNSNAYVITRVGLSVFCVCRSRKATQETRGASACGDHASAEGRGRKVTDGGRGARAAREGASEAVCC